MKQEELKEIASQLKHPTGEKGIEMANMMHEVNNNMIRHAIQNLNISNGNIILELGHGNPGYLDFIFEKADRLKYYGLEISELMSQEARQKNRNFVSQKQAFFSVYDGNTIPFEAESFDKIFTVNTIYFWQDPENLLSEIYRVLKPNGNFCLTFAEESFMKKLPFTQFEFELYTSEKVENLVRKTQFKIVNKETLTESIKTRTGEETERDYTTFVLEK
jgi:ubiquinone/menaquinone biosynthesis C-methylase UbiE